MATCVLIRLLLAMATMGQFSAQAIIATAGAPPPPPPPPPIKDNPGEQIPGPAHPEDPSAVAAWRESLGAWRARTLAKINYNGSIYDVPELRWTQTSYIQPQMHPYDRFFFDGQNYTVQKWLDDVNASTANGTVEADGNHWAATDTNIGADARSQFNLFSAMPGGLARVRLVVDELHAAGVKVLLPYNPWDLGTRRATNATGGIVSDAMLLDDLIKIVDADGFNGDTMGSVPQSFYTTSEGLNHPVAIEPEGGGQASLGFANWDTMGWGYWKYPVIPMVDSWKFLDSRRMTNICERWSKDHTNALQYALFNGDGFESWENVWGTWNGITPRDGEQIRRVGAILRFLGSRRYLQSQFWVPHSPTAKPATLFSSLWPAADGSNTSAAWTVVNRDVKNASTGPAINITMVPPAGVRWHYYDLYHGKELRTPAAGTIDIDLEISGYGAVLVTPNASSTDPELAAFLAKMNKMTAVPLQSLSNVWQYEQQRRLPVAPAPAPAPAPTLPAVSTGISAPPPAGMVKIPGGKFRFAVQGIEIEGGGTNINVNPYGVDFQYEWDPVPQRFHVQWMQLKPYFIDKHPVTQAQWETYLTSGGKLPTDTWHYLWDWDWSGSLPKPKPGNESKPVVYIGLDEARAYCASLGKRLPREEEWQYAGQGGDLSAPKFPWGSIANSSLMPKQESGQFVPSLDNVGKYSPAGDSLFGVADLLGNVWQYTDEHEDAHTRSCCLRGGSKYRPAGSHWYFPNTADLVTHEKYFLMSPRYERAGTISFRCAQDLPMTEQTSSCGQALCGSFAPPAAFTDLSSNVGASEFAVWGISGTGIGATRSSGDTAISDIYSRQPLKQCNLQHQQVAFSWTGANTTGGSNATGSNVTAVGVCQQHGTGMHLVVRPRHAGNHSLSLFAGTQAGSHSIDVTLSDGGKNFSYSEQLLAVGADLTTNVWSNVRWDLAFETTSAAVLTVHLAAVYSNGHYISPPAPPPLSPCSQFCGNILPVQNQKNDLSILGSADWAHYGDKMTVQTIAGSPLPYCAHGAMVPSDPNDKSNWALAGGATLIGSKTAGFTDLRSGGPNGHATATLTAHIEGSGHNIEGIAMSFRYITGYGCAGTSKPCSGAPIVMVVLVDATTMQDLATIWTSTPLGNYSYGSFTGYSPPVKVQVHGLNVTNVNPVLVQLRISNNERNLQMQLAPVNGLNLNVTWTKQAYATNASNCEADCVQATLTTDKCGVNQPLIQPLSILGNATKVGSYKPLGLGVPRPTFLWTDGFQTAFTDERGESNALAASGIGAGFGSTITVPPSKTRTVIRLYVGVIGTDGQLTATVSGSTIAAHYNETFVSGSGTKFGIATLQVPASATACAVHVTWAQVGPLVNGSVLLGAIAVQGEPNTTALRLSKTTLPGRKCLVPPSSVHTGTLMLQAAVLT